MQYFLKTDDIAQDDFAWNQIIHTLIYSKFAEQVSNHLLIVECKSSEAESGQMLAFENILFSSLLWEKKGIYGCLYTVTTRYMTTWLFRKNYNFY